MALALWMLRRQQLYDTVKHLVLSHYNVSGNEQLEDKTFAFIHLKPNMYVWIHLLHCGGRFPESLRPPGSTWPSLASVTSYRLPWWTREGRKDRGKYSKMKGDCLHYLWCIWFHTVSLAARRGEYCSETRREARYLKWYHRLISEDEKNRDKCGPSRRRVERKITKNTSNQHTKQQRSHTLTHADSCHIFRWL